jgi:RNA 2',3'-cyclic 3'-phosphodiesterase
MKRTFIAVRVEAGEELKNAISFLRSELRNENIKWVDISNMHVTLGFIGNTDEPVINKVESMLKNEFAGFGIIGFRLTGFGVFRNFSNPRIIWIGIDNSDKLAEGYELVKIGLEKLDIDLEERQFKPHLTVGRINYLRDKNNLQKLVKGFEGKFLQDVTISEIVYYESVLLPAGPLYKPISTILLNE